MFLKIRKRITYTNVVMTLALIFTMSGGAYAAGKYLISSTKQISPKVLKALVGKHGAVGKEGAPGKEGPTGKDGFGGKEGKEGPPGKEGKEGSLGKEGKEGKAGPTGSPWTAGGTLPSGQTETGSWATFKSPEGLDVASISFDIPLALPLDEEHALVATASKAAGHCNGTPANPTAEPGYLCVYDGEGTIYEVADPSATENGLFKLGAGTAGAAVITNGGKEYDHGTWAVTAK